MAEEIRNASRKRLGRNIFIGTIIATLAALLLVALDTDLHPRTDDASVRANSIEIARKSLDVLSIFPSRITLL